MAALLPKVQKFVSLNDGVGTVIGIHVVTMVSASGDTLTVPNLSQTATDKTATNTGSCAVLLKQDGNTATLTDDANADTANVITINGATVGQDLVIVTCHPPAQINYGNED